MLTLLFLVTVIVSCHVVSSAVAGTKTRQGNLNKYFVYTRETNRQFYELDDIATSINNSPILERRDTAIIIHGHQGSAFSSLNPDVKDAYLTSDDVNVIVVDWSVYAQQSYSNAVSAVPSVGVFIAGLITHLVEANKVDLNRLHVVGFNLGAHAAGFVGRTLRGQIARITGLDPSSNQWGSNSGRLSMADARYVEVIHTDGSGFMSNGIGIAIGHVDFFPNGGNNQPGCLTKSCSHNRAWELFAASLIFDNLIGNKCSNSFQLSTNLCRGYAVNMGNNHYVKFGSGTFRVNTRGFFPF